MNYFAHTTAAQRYAKGRPYFHPLVMERIAAYWPKQIPFGQALDVGCGTGHSSKALLLIAKEVIATDVSLEMLSQTQPDPHIRYVQSPAEALPFPDHSFDLITSCMAFHWFDQPKFLQEATRLLRPPALMAIYGHGFKGRMQGNPEFSAWHDDFYLHHYPVPPRQSADQSRQQLEQSGWLRDSQPFEHTIPMTAEELVQYLMTQSNVIVKIEQGQESAQHVFDRLLGSVQPLFKQPVEEMEFQGGIWFCQRP